MKLELVVVPVADVDAALAWYRDRLGWTVDVDARPMPGARVVQVTPPGSGCSIGFGEGMAVYAEASPGRALHLVVRDVDDARTELVGRGVEVGPVADVGGGVRYAAFADADGNAFVLQEMAWRSGNAF